MKFNFAGGGLCLEIRKHISEQQSRHVQRGRGGSVCSAAAPVAAVDEEEAETSVTSGCCVYRNTLGVLIDRRSCRAVSMRTDFITVENASPPECGHVLSSRMYGGPI